MSDINEKLAVVSPMPIHSKPTPDFATIRTPGSRRLGLEYYDMRSGPPISRVTSQLGRLGLRFPKGRGILAPVEIE